MLFNKAHITREQWLQEATDLIMDEIIYPKWAVREDLKIKISVGYAPNTKANSNRIGVCLSSACSAEKYNEIFLSPERHDSLEMLATLVHEIIHAIDDCKNGHQGPFLKMMAAFGLEGKPTATTASKKLADHLQTIIDVLGPIPHAKVSLGTTKRQVNRNIKVFCDACGFKFNTSRAQIQHVLDLAGECRCPACSQAMQCTDF